MKIEFVEYAADEAMHPQHEEIVVLVTTEAPMGPADWPEVWRAMAPAERSWIGQQCGTGERSGATSGTGASCKFDVDHEHEMDPETEGYVQWWAFPKK